MVHALVVSRLPLRRRTLSHAMHAYRFRWMENTVRRDSKMVDALIQNSLQQGVLFFASTSILVLGALLAGLGAAEQAVNVLGELPLASTDTPLEWELKVLLVIAIVTYAFFKFAWSYRLFNYLIILIGAGPDGGARDAPPDAAELEAWSTKLGKLHAVAAYHFTAGIHAYFHALSAMTWFLSPWLFIADDLVGVARAVPTRLRLALPAHPHRPRRRCRGGGHAYRGLTGASRSDGYRMDDGPGTNGRRQPERSRRQALPSTARAFTAEVEHERGLAGRAAPALGGSWP